MTSPSNAPVSGFRQRPNRFCRSGNTGITRISTPNCRESARLASSSRHIPTTIPKKRSGTHASAAPRSLAALAMYAINAMEPTRSRSWTMPRIWISAFDEGVIQAAMTQIPIHRG